MDNRETGVTLTQGAVDIAESAISVAQLQRRMALIQDAMRNVMKKDEDYGIIPGTPKPTLLKPGAEKLCSMFQFDTQYEITEQRDGEHLTIISRCILYHAPTTGRLGSGMGLCTTKETRYAFRHATRQCPACGKEAIIKGKAEYGGGWVCFGKKGGCGTKYPDGDSAIESQEVGKVPNENPADQYNTAVKMANKRSLIAAVLNVTAASSIFTQDLEDEVETDPTPPSPAAPVKPPVQPPQRRSQVTPPVTPNGTADWRKMTSKFDSKCNGGCDTMIKTGTTIYYSPENKSALCEGCYDMQANPV